MVKCTYCKKDAALTPTDYGNIWECKPCDARVGAHHGKRKPYGTLADKETRYWRMRAHKEFDPLWQWKVRYHNVSKGYARRAAYRWLSKRLGVEEKKCHIANFQSETCKMIVKICQPYKQKLKWN